MKVCQGPLYPSLFPRTFDTHDHCAKLSLHGCIWTQLCMAQHGAWSCILESHFLIFGCHSLCISIGFTKTVVPKSTYGTHAAFLAQITETNVALLSILLKAFSSTTLPRRKRSGLVLGRLELRHHQNANTLQPFASPFFAGQLMSLIMVIHYFILLFPSFFFVCDFKM